MDLSGLFVAMSAIGVAWVAAYYGFLTAQETSKKDSQLANENYQRELLKERNQTLLEPLRAEIAELETFRKALMFYHLSRDIGAFPDEKADEAELALIDSASVVYKYPLILAQWEAYYPYPRTLEKLQILRGEVEDTLGRKRTDLNGWLRRFYAPEPGELEQEQPIPQEKIKHGPLVRSALAVETWLKRFR